MKLTTHDDNQRRTERLRKALRIACAIMGVTDEQADLLVTEVEDYKGTLIVTWATWPITPTQKHAFDAAWSECREYCVEHRPATSAQQA